MFPRLSRRHVLHGCVGVALLLAAGFARAQYARAPLRSVQGTVHDRTAEPLRGAVVQVEAEDTMAIQSYVTDERGTFHFRNLRPDADYRVWATFRGQRSKVEEMSKFDHKTDREFTLVIDLSRE